MTQPPTGPPWQGPPWQGPPGQGPPWQGPPPPPAPPPSWPAPPPAPPPPPPRPGVSTGTAVLLVGLVVLVGAAAVVVALVVAGDDDDTGSGSGRADGAPTDASAADFCAVYLSRTAANDSEAPPEEQVAAAHELADDLVDVGTPDGFGDDARAGFEVLVRVLEDADADTVAALRDVDAEGAAEVLGISDEESADLEALVRTGITTCADHADLEPDLPDPSTG